MSGDGSGASAPRELGRTDECQYCRERIVLSDGMWWHQRANGLGMAVSCGMVATPEKVDFRCCAHCGGFQRRCIWRGELLPTGHGFSVHLTMDGPVVGFIEIDPNMRARGMSATGSDWGWTTGDCWHVGSGACCCCNWQQNDPGHVEGCDHCRPILDAYLERQRPAARADYQPPAGAA